MPSARPIPVSMLMTKTESSNCCATTAVSPSATTIETIAMSSGTSPATTAPKTSSRMMSAAGRPNFSSPFSRSSCESRLKSWSSVCSPVTATANAPSSSAPDLLDQGLRLVLARDRDRDDRRVADRPRRGRRPLVEIRARAGERGDLALLDELPHVRPELRANPPCARPSGRRRCRGTACGDRAEAPGTTPRRPLGLGVVRRLALGREAPAEKRHDRDDGREHDDRAPSRRSPARGAARWRRRACRSSDIGVSERLVIRPRPRSSKPAVVTGHSYLVEKREASLVVLAPLGEARRPRVLRLARRASTASRRARSAASPWRRTSRSSAGRRPRRSPRSRRAGRTRGDVLARTSSSSTDAAYDWSWPWSIVRSLSMSSDVGVADRLERLLPRLPGGGRAEDVERPLRSTRR